MGVSVLQEFNWGCKVSSQVFCSTKIADKEVLEMEESSSSLLAVPEEALALLFDATVLHQAILFSFVGSLCTSTLALEEENDQVQGQIQGQTQLLMSE